MFVGRLGVRCTGQQRRLNDGGFRHAFALLVISKRFHCSFGRVRVDISLGGLLWVIAAMQQQTKNSRLMYV